MKTTKKEARKIYDLFFGVIRNCNSGTAQENKRMASYCFEQMKKHAATAKELAENPNKHLKNDKWLFDAINITIPNRVNLFAERYGL